MKIKRIEIENFRLFKSDLIFVIDKINIPDGVTLGSGLTVFVGENGCGKTAILDAISMPLLSYKAEANTVSDFNDLNKKIKISVFSDNPFEVKGTMPNSSFKSIGFLFEAGLRTRGNKAYLSSVLVSDRKYLKPSGQIKPDDVSPDLRVDVNNPFLRQRFSENDILFLDKNRTYQTRSGTFNPTRFDKLMEDFNYQFLKKSETIEDIEPKLDFIKEGIENEFLKNTIKKFKSISGLDIGLKLIKNQEPFYSGFLASTTNKNIHVPLDKFGSGYEMIFSILYSFYLSTQSNKQLIILIDEPELHLHPSLQSKLVDILLEYSKTAQIILSTHSALFVKQLLKNERVLVNIIRNSNSIEIIPMEERLLPYISSNEVNYIAFNLSTEEYHNELYEELKSQIGIGKGYKEFDNDYFINRKNEIKAHPWKKELNQVSIHTFIRNQIHHPKENAPINNTEMEYSIKKLRDYLKELSKVGGIQTTLL